MLKKIIIFVTLCLAFTCVKANENDLSDELKEFITKNYSNNTTVSNVAAMCVQGHSESCFLLARYIDDGVYVKKNKKVVTQLFEHACANGNNYACLRIDKANVDDLSKEFDKYYGQCESGDFEACEHISNITNSINLLQNPKLIRKTLPLAEKMCDLKIRSACENLGYYYYDGNGVKRNRHKGLYYLKQACDLKASNACNQYGYLQINNAKSKKEQLHAFDYFLKACALNNPQACHNVAVIYESDNFAKRDLKKAQEFYKKACIIGMKESCQQIKK